MPNASQLNFEERDLTVSATDPIDTIMGVSGVTPRGKVNTPDTVFSSWKKLLKVHGGFSNLNPDVIHQIKRAMDRGTRVRVSRKGHYTNPLSPGTLSMVTATPYAGWGVTFGSTPLTSTSTLEVNFNGSGYATIPWAGSHNFTVEAMAKYLNDNYRGQNIKGAFIPKSTTLGANNFSLNAVGQTSTGITSLLVRTTIGGTPTIYTGAAGTSYIGNTLGTSVITVAPIAPGADYNNLFITILPGSNGQPGYFDVYIRNNADENASETYNNQYLKPVTTADLQTGTAEMQASELVKWTFADMTGFTPTQLDLLPGMVGFTGGTDGGALVELDYIGGGAGIGLRSWDAYDDLTAIVDIDRDATSTTLVQSGVAYAEDRKDLVYLIQLQDLQDENALATQRDNTLVDSSYAAFYAGWLKVKHPVTGADAVIPGMGDVLGLAGFNINRYGAQSSWAGLQHGIITSTTGPNNNFGGPGSLGARKLLANHQINTIILNKRKIYLDGNFTAQYNTSILSYLSVRMMIIQIRRELSELLEKYLQEANSPRTWKQIYLEAKPIMDSWVKDDGLYDYQWNGDQFASDLNRLTTNDKDDVGQGKYRIDLLLHPIPRIQEITLGIILTRTSVSFDEVLGQLNA